MWLAGLVVLIGAVAAVAVMIAGEDDAGLSVPPGGSSAPAEADNDGSPVADEPVDPDGVGAGEAVGWELLDEPSVFGGDGEQLTFAGTVLADRRVVVGMDDRNATGGMTRPGVWIQERGDGWRRVPSDQIDDGGGVFARFGLVMQDVAASADGVLAAVGYAEHEDALVPVTWRSDDAGESWELIVGDPDVVGAVFAVTEVAGGFVAAGTTLDQATVWRSPDGGRWDADRLPAKGAANGLAVAGDRVVISVLDVDDNGGSGALWSWNPNDDAGSARATNLPPGMLPYRVASDPDGDGFVLAGTRALDNVTQEAIVVVYPDGRTWEELATLTGPQVPNIAILNGRLLLARGGGGSSSGIWISIDTLGGDLAQIPPQLIPPAVDVGWVLEDADHPTVFGFAPTRDRDTLIWHQPPSHP